MSGLMATGYVHQMLDKNLDFSQFALTCARAMGALIMMRDEPMDAPIPERFEPSDYYVRKAAEARATLARFTAMSNDERIAYAESERARRVAELCESKASRDRETARVRGMLAEVEAWTPPTPEHEPFKEFMRSQLAQSLDGGSWIEDEIAKWRRRAPVEIYAEAVTSAERGITYYEQHHAEEIERTESRNRWLADLRKSLATKRVIR